MSHADDQCTWCTYRGVRIEKRCTAIEMRNGLTVRIYSWVAQGEYWVVMASSADRARTEIDAHLDRASPSPAP